MANLFKRSYLFSVLAFTAGFSFLIFELSWFRMLALLLGATVSASTLVLSVFMAGMGTGAMFWSKRNLSIAKAGLFLSILFLVIGVYGAISIHMLHSVLPLLALSMNSISFLALCVVFLFIPSFFMGGLLPLLSRIMVQRMERISSDLGHMYAFETLGSAMGSLFTGFLLIRVLGQNNSIFVASALNIILAGVLIFKRATFQLNDSETNNALSGKPKNTHQNVGKSKPNMQLPLVFAFLTGFVVIALQVIWIRVFKVYMTNTSYTFALVAAMVIMGLFIGSRLYVRYAIKNFSLVEITFAFALSILIGFVLMLNLHSLVFFPLASWQEMHWVRIFLIPFLSSVLLIVPVAVLSGFAFPYACAMYTTNVNSIHRSVGNVLLFNTIGSAIGPVFAAFFLVPVFGAALSVLALLLIVLAALLYFLIQQRKDFSSKWIAPAVGIAMGIIIITLFIEPKLYILPPSFTKNARQILAYKESVEGTLVVGKESDAENSALSTYVNNSAVIGSSYDAIKAVKMVGHLPFFAGLKCKNALVVGFGIGVTTSAIASHSEVENIDCIELVEGLKNTAHYYSTLNNNIVSDSRLKIMSGDGRHFLQDSDKKYDLISSDPTHPILGSGSLYTKEYFELCKQHLNPGGMVSQYLPIHKLLLSDLLGIIKTFHSVFPESTVWLGHYHLILLGSNGPLRIDFNEWQANIAKSVKDPYFYTNPYHVAACLLLDKESIAKFPDRIKVNTDNNSYVEFFKLSSFGQENTYTNLQHINTLRTSVGNVFSNVPNSAAMSRFVSGNKELTLGLVEMLKRNNNGLLSHLQTATRINPENEEFPFLIKFYFNQ